MRRVAAGFTLVVAVLATAGCGSQVRDYIADTYEHRGSSGDIDTYNSPDTVGTTVSDIVANLDPAARKADGGNEYLRYNDDIVTVGPAAGGGSTIRVEDLDGRWFSVADADRATYHAAAAVASNHLVALLGQAARLAEGIGVPPEAYLDLARATLDNVASLGPSAALTGPAARCDWETVARHLAAIAEDERPAYRALAAAAARLAGTTPPPNLLQP